MFTCKGCREVSRLVGEVEDIRHVLETTKRVMTGQGLEEESGGTGIKWQDGKKRRRRRSANVW